MVYGIIQLINFAHGEIYNARCVHRPDRAGALTIYGFSGWRSCCSPVWWPQSTRRPTAIPGADCLPPAAQAPRLSPLISAIGMSLFLQNYVMLAQTPIICRSGPDPGVRLPRTGGPHHRLAEVVILLTSTLLMVGLTY